MNIKQIRQYLPLLKHPLTLLAISLAVFILLVIFYANLPSPGNEKPPQATPSDPLPREENPDGNLLRTESLPSGEVRNLYKSPVSERPHETITSKDGNKVLFQRTVMPQNTQAATINSYLGSLGVPEDVYQGSRFYGESPITYIYASKGIAFIGDDENHIVEIQKFQPMSVDEYRNKYGSDIFEDPSH